MSERSAEPRRSLRGLTIAAVIGLLILCGLGTWQVERLAWKTDLIATVEARTALPPIAAPGPDAWPELDFATADYLPVTLSGTFQNVAEAHVFANLAEPHGPLGGAGYFILTPFLTDAGFWVIVNRGFVPEELKEPVTRASGQIEGETTITGLLREPQGTNAFTPANETDANVWFTRDPAAIGAARGIPAGQLAPYYVDAAFDPSLPEGVPQGGETEVTFTNNHLQYALTWYGLALALVVMYVAVVRQRRKTASAPPPG
jgi:surfeit locus 1 family protein